MPRADLHVHSWHSGYNHDLPFLRSRDCYADPVAVYRTAKARGMDFVTITDHDSIDGCLELLDGCPVWTTSSWARKCRAGCRGARVEVHFGVWGLTEAIHRDLQPLRENAFDVAAFLRGAGVLFSFNHPLHFYRGQLKLDEYLRLVEAAPAVEARNGAMLSGHNEFAARLAASAGRTVDWGQRCAHAAPHRPHLDRRARPHARGVSGGDCGRTLACGR